MYFSLNRVAVASFLVSVLAVNAWITDELEGVEDGDEIELSLMRALEPDGWDEDLAILFDGVESIRVERQATESPSSTKEERQKAKEERKKKKQESKDKRRDEKQEERGERSEERKKEREDRQKEREARKEERKKAKEERKKEKEERKLERQKKKDVIKTE